MSILHYENWDGASPPAAPSGWTFQSGSGLITTASGPTPISSPNMIEQPAAAIGTFAAIWNTQDGVGGNVTVQGTGLFFGSSGLSTVDFGVFGRASSATNPYSGTCYQARMAGDGGGTGECDLLQYISGTPTTLASVSISSVSYDLWYQITLTLNGTAHNVAIQRLTDGFWLNFSGNFTSSVGYAISEGDSAISGQGYSGWSATTNNVIPVYGDDWTLTGLSAPTIPPNRPVIAAFPFQYYPAYAE